MSKATETRAETIQQAQEVVDRLNARFAGKGWTAQAEKNVWWFGFAWHEAAGIKVRRSPSPRPQYYAHFLANPREVGRGQTPEGAVENLTQYWDAQIRELTAEADRMAIIREAK